MEGGGGFRTASQTEKYLPVITTVSDHGMLNFTHAMNDAGKDGDGKPTNVQYTEIPFELMKNEEDVLRVLAGGTDEFAALFPPTARNF